MTLKILLTGKNGQVGRELISSLRPLGDVVAVGHAELDLTKPEEIREAIRGVRPQLIVNAAAYTAVDQAESEEAIARAVNADAPGVMAEEAKTIGAAMVHYSTDYVFDGSKTLPYLETDPTNPINCLRTHETRRGRSRPELRRGAPDFPDRVGVRKRREKFPAHDLAPGHAAGRIENRPRPDRRAHREPGHRAWVRRKRCREFIRRKKMRSRFPASAEPIT